MSKEKKAPRHLTGKVEIKATLSQLRQPAAAKLHSRGPKQLGQLKKTITVRIGKVRQEEMGKRLDLAESILNTGKVPASVKGGSAKTAKDTDNGRAAAQDMAKLALEKLELTNQAFQEQTEELETAKARIIELTEECNKAYTSIDQLNSEKNPPVETPIPDETPTPDPEPEPEATDPIDAEPAKPKGK